MRTLTRPERDALTPHMALEVLRKGNERFVNNLKVNRNLLQQVNETSGGQYPLAVVLSCIDSRTSAELIFDQGLGDIFSVRIAGNIINEDILGSMEFACKVAGAKALVVLGHSKCGAVKGACDHVEMGNLTNLLSKLQPAVYAEKTVTTDRSSANDEFVEKVATLNVKMAMHQIHDKSTILNDMILKGDIAIIGGMYNVETGVVDFYEE